MYGHLNFYIYARLAHGASAEVMKQCYNIIIIIHVLFIVKYSMRTSALAFKQFKLREEWI